jgi:sugar phosphate isomerase/epimerase
VRLAAPGAPHLTYCTNVHPGESWAEVRANLERHVLAVRRRVAPDAPFGLGLRLSARAADELSAPDVLAELREFLGAHRLYVFTVNGFPYGPFSGTPVKEHVYRPDWLEDARLRYTDRLAALLAELLPADVGGSISTVPGAFKPRVRAAGDADAMADRLVRAAATLHAIRERTGKSIILALEPEPCCHCETIAETIAFFTRVFSRRSIAALARLTGIGAGASEAALRRHLGVCFDACHMAVEFEEPAAALDALAAAGIAVGKIQLSAGLAVEVAPGDAETRRALARFAEGVYLHQVVARSGDQLRRYLDLPEALATVGDPGAASLVHAEPPDGARDAPSAWRIHFHVPLFREHLGRFRSTQPYVRALLELIRRDVPSPHLEVETYTWDVLPEEYRDEPVDVAVARELVWVRERLEAAA